MTNFKVMELLLEYHSRKGIGRQISSLFRLPTTNSPVINLLEQYMARYECAALRYSGKFCLSDFYQFAKARGRETEVYEACYLSNSLSGRLFRKIWDPSPEHSLFATKRFIIELVEWGQLTAEQAVCLTPAQLALLSSLNCMKHLHKDIKKHRLKLQSINHFSDRLCEKIAYYFRDHLILPTFAHLLVASWSYLNRIADSLVISFSTYFDGIRPYLISKNYFSQEEMDNISIEEISAFFSHLDEPSPGFSDGWRQRCYLIINIPPDVMRAANISKRQLFTLPLSELFFLATNTLQAYARGTKDPAADAAGSNAISIFTPLSSFTTGCAAIIRDIAWKRRLHAITFFAPETAEEAGTATEADVESAHRP